MISTLPCDSWSRRQASERANQKSLDVKLAHFSTQSTVYCYAGGAAKRSVTGFPFIRQRRNGNWISLLQEWGWVGYRNVNDNDNDDNGRVEDRTTMTRLTQKAMLKPTSILLIKPIAAVVWRWSLIFHATLSFPLFLNFPFFLALLLFLFCSSSALQPSPCHHRKSEITRMKMRNFRT